ncbi:SRPBCC family protein [Crateriforma conspicua]|nr:hypothetical protein [Crateriforma conspicua]
MMSETSMGRFCRRWFYCWLVAGVSLFFVGAAFHFLIPVFAPHVPEAFENTHLFRPWSGWTSAYMAIHPLIFAVVFSAFFLGLRDRTAFPAGVRGGALYGIGVFVVGSLPVFLLVYAAMAMTTEIAVLWTVQNAMQYLIAGAAMGSVADGVHIQAAVKLPAPANRVWDLLLRKDTFLEITRGMMAYENTGSWPETLFSPDTTLTTRVRPFGIGPASRHEVRVVQVDASQQVIQTDESGGLVTTWQHTMRIESLSDQRCRYIDRIFLHAGIITPAIGLFAMVFYRYRQHRWKRLLRRSV